MNFNKMLIFSWMKQVFLSHTHARIATLYKVENVHVKQCTLNFVSNPYTNVIYNIK